MKEQIRATKIKLSNEEIDNTLDAEIKTLVIRMLIEMIEFGHKIKEEMKVMQSEIRKYTGNQQRRERNQDSNQQFATKGRNKHLPGTE